MIGKSVQLGKASLAKEELSYDKKNCKKFGPCGVGKKALYLNSFYIDRMYYVKLTSVKRVFKRIAMSKGGFSGKGMFASIPYLVVQYDDGKEKQCNFKQEEQVDALLCYLGEQCPSIPLHSVEAERMLKEKAAALEEKKKKLEDAQARADVQILERARTYLEKRPDLSNELSFAAKGKRANEQSNPMYKWAALFITLFGLASALYGIYALMTHAGFAIYFLLFGLAGIFLFSGMSVGPTEKNNRHAIEERLRAAVEEMQKYIGTYPNFPLPAYYAHPVVLQRMIWILVQNRAKDIPESLEVLKEDLKALNSSVEVEREEYEEIVAIKPLFLIRGYE